MLDSGVHGTRRNSSETSNQPPLRIVVGLQLLLGMSIGFMLLASGCRKAPQATVPTHPYSGPTLPDQVELSKTPGVSIVQCPAGVARTDRIGGDGSSASAEAETATLDSVILAWCNFSGWIKLDADLPDRRYNIRVAADDEHNVWSRVKPAFEEVFGIRFVEGLEPTAAVVLRKSQAVPTGLTRVEAQTNWGTAQTAGGFGYKAGAASMAELAKIVARYVDEPVLEETGLEGNYQFELAMDHWQPKTVFPAVEKLGLKLVREQRDLNIMRVVRAGGKPEAP